MSRLTNEELATLVENASGSLLGWQQIIGVWALSKGWWNEFLQYGRPVAELLDAPSTTHRTHYIASKLALVHSEVSEAMESLRLGHIEAYVADGKPEGLETELADTIIRILDLANALGLDMGKAVAKKMQYNVTREYRHGGKAM